MTRETKINLGFLIAFLALSLPGAAILFVKKLEPGQRMLYEPSFMRRTEAYNNPLPATSSSVRTFPPKTLAWTAQVARRANGRPPYRLVAAGGREQPVVSDKRRFEWLGTNPATDARPASVDVLFWADDFNTADGTAITGEVRYDESTAAVASASAQTLPVPEAVVRELLDEGFSKPPRRVSLLRLALGPGAGPDVPRRLELAWRERDGREARDAATLDPALLSGASPADSEAEATAGLDVAAGSD